MDGYNEVSCLLYEFSCACTFYISMIHILSFLGRVLDTHRDEYMQFLLELKQGGEDKRPKMAFENWGSRSTQN